MKKSPAGFLVVSLVALLIVSGCSSAGSPTPSTPSTPAAPAAPAPKPSEPPKLEDTVVFGGFGGSNQSVLEEHVFPEFTKKTGVKVTYVSGTAAKLLAQAAASAANPDIDVLWTNPLTHLQGKTQGLFDKIDYSVVTNAANLFANAKDPNDIGIVMGLNPFGLDYNKKALAAAGIAPPTSWNDLWDPKYKGKVALYNINIAFTQFWLPAFAKSLGTTTDKMDPVFKKLSELKPQLAALVASPAESATMYQQDAIWISVNSNARAFQLRDSGVDVDWVAPKEGAVEFFNYFEVIKKAPHPNAAQALINHMLGPEVQTLLAEKMYYGPVYKGLKLSDKLARETYYSATGENSLVPIDVADLVQRLPEWSRRWDAEVAR